MSLPMITREQWGARYGRGHATEGAKTLVIFHHDGINRLTPTSTLDDEIAVWRMFEEYHSKTNGWDGIAYTAGLMPYSGRLFEGRGFGRTGAHTPGKNSQSWGICLPCDGDTYSPEPHVVEMFQRWRAEAIRLGFLSPRHTLKGHQDFNKPDCPGSKVYQKLVIGLQTIAAPNLTDMIRAQPTLREGKGGKNAGPVEVKLVKDLQLRLIGLRLLRVGDSTGFFGPITARAVRQFQAIKGLKPDGIVGPLTWKALNAH